MNLEQSQLNEAYVKWEKRDSVKVVRKGECICGREVFSYQAAWPK